VGDIPRRSDELYPEQLSVTIRAHRIIAFNFPAWLHCADGSVLGIAYSSAQHHVAPISFGNDHFSFSLGALLGEDGSTIRATGTVTAGSTVVGTVHIVGLEDTGVHDGAQCSQSYRYTAALPFFAQTQLNVALGDIAKLGSVHVTESATTSAGTVRYSTDVARNEGRQTVDIPSVGRARVLVAVGRAYVYSRQAAVLMRFFHLPSPAARAARGHWLEVPDYSIAFPAIAANVTIPSVTDFLGSMTPLGDTASTTRAGRRVVGISGDGAKTGTNYMTLYVTTSPKPLPVSLSYRVSGATQIFAFTRWGERVSVKPPRRALSLERLLSPSGGGRIAGHRLSGHGVLTSLEHEQAISDPVA
jgi:hypothetical protein